MSDEKQQDASEGGIGQSASTAGLERKPVIGCIGHDGECCVNREQEQRDASRYRWLRRQPNDVSAPRIDVVQWTEADESANEGEGLRMEALDAAIDDAMRSNA